MSTTVMSWSWRSDSVLGELSKILWKFHYFGLFLLHNTPQLWDAALELEKGSAYFWVPI
jgi:hypothetical protein